MARIHPLFSLGFKIVTICLATIPTFLIVVYLAHSLGDLSGFYFNWDVVDCTFNWHPLLMVLAYSAVFSFGAISFRAPTFTRKISKSFHLIFQTTAMVLSTMGMVIIFEFKNKIHKPAHFVTLHSWLGLVTWIIFTLQWVVGVFCFMPSLFNINFPPEKLRGFVKPFHIYTGVMLYVSATIALLTGLVDKEWVYSATQAKTPVDPRGEENLVLSFTGIFILATAWMVLSYLIKGPIPVEGADKKEEIKLYSGRSDSEYEAINH